MPLWSSSPEPSWREPSINPRQILAKIRGGDYAHAGDVAAIELVITKALELSPPIKQGPCLDVGSGYGGTAAYLSKLGFQSIHGIDLDAAAVQYAQKHYPEASFIAGDALRASDHFDQHFSFLTLFNVIYAIKDKHALLTELSKLGRILAIMDYTTTSSTQLKDLTGKPMYPIVLAEFSHENWTLLETTDLTQQFIQWYEDLLPKLHDYPELEATFTALLSQLKSGQIGGAAIYLQSKVSASAVSS